MHWVLATSTLTTSKLVCIVLALYTFPLAYFFDALAFIHYGRHGNKALKKMLEKVRKCSKDSSMNAPEDLCAAAVKSIDSYLKRARNSDGTWNEGLVPFDYGVQASDAMMPTILSCRRALTKQRVVAIEAAAKEVEITPSVTPLSVELAKETGLNFNVLCCLWLGLVDVNEHDFPSKGSKSQASLIPKFLSRSVESVSGSLGFCVGSFFTLFCRPLSTDFSDWARQSNAW